MTPSAVRPVNGAAEASHIPGVTQLSLLPGVKCEVIHLDGREREATHRAWTRLEPDEVSDVCESCARGLKALGWMTLPSDEELRR